MRTKTIVMALWAAFLFAPLQAHAQDVFHSGTPGTQGFTFFPFWQQVLTDMANARPERPEPMPSPSAALRSPAVQGAKPAIFTPAAFKPTEATTPNSACVNLRTCLPRAWLTFLDTLRGQSRQAQMNAVNRWMNTRPYIEDWTNWGVPDYWETPAEFLSRGGDCEDFAIAKYFSLRRLGFADSDLRIVIVNDTNLNSFHAVLNVRLNGQTWLLDNQLAQVVPMAIAVQYKPVYSLNAHNWWMHSIPQLTVSTVTLSANGTSEHRGLFE
ncbi:MAG TPA: transglutaminase-like cysteine peptidase [Rhizomicrobium sp.]|nr:transglutaminase-like cysteine peptidase [Rhizomicrobium sp.]